MNLDDVYKIVQASLADWRGISDVAFTPLGYDAVRVSYYEKGGLRAHFAFCADEYEHAPELLRQHVRALAFQGAQAATARNAVKMAHDVMEAAGLGRIL